MKLIKKKIKYFLLIYFKNKKKYIYNIMIYTIIKNLKNYLIKILPDLITFFLIFLKFFKTFYFVKIVLTQIPMCNTYQWPFSILRIIYKPYSRFWSYLLPKIKIGTTLIDVSYIVGLEILNKLTRILIILKIIAINYAEN